MNRKDKLEAAIEYVIGDVVHDCAVRQDIPVDFKEKVAVLAELYVAIQHCEEIHVDIVKDGE